MSGPEGGVPPVSANPHLPEWYEQTRALLNARVPDVLICKECKQPTATLVPDMISLRSVSASVANPKYLGRGLEYPSVTTICRNCGHMSLFNAFVLGLDTGAEIKAAASRLPEPPTKAELNGWKLQWVGLAMAAIALVVSGFVGGLALTSRSGDSRPTPPIIIQMPEQHR